MIKSNRSDNELQRRKFLLTIGGAGLVTFAGCTNSSGGNSGSNGSGGNSGSNGSGGNSGSNSSGDGSSGSNSAVQWSLGTGSQGGSSYVIGSTLAAFMKEKGLTNVVQLSAVETSGTLASYRKLDQGQVQMSGTNGGFLANSPNKGIFSDQPLNNFNKIRQMRTYFTAQSFFVSKKGSGINSFADFKGKTILVSPTGSGLRPLSEFILEKTVGLKNIKTRYSSWSNVPKRLQSGQVDASAAFIVDNIVPPSHAQQLDSTVDWKPIPFPKSLQKAINNYPGNTYSQVNAGKWADKYTGKLDTFVSPYIYVSRSDYSKKAVYEITKTTFEHAKELGNRNNLLTLFPNTEDSLGLMSPNVPVHRGAYKYFKEAGLWSKYDLTKPPTTKK